jgi:uncharacterized membrane protein
MDPRNGLHRHCCSGTLVLKSSQETSLCPLTAFPFRVFCLGRGRCFQISAILSCDQPGLSLVCALEGSLMIKFVITVVESLLMFARGGKQQYPVEMEDAWIASNAAIGGPATAVAFCQPFQLSLQGAIMGGSRACVV